MGTCSKLVRQWAKTLFGWRTKEPPKRVLKAKARATAKDERENPYPNEAEPGHFSAQSVFYQPAASASLGNLEVQVRSHS